MRQFAAPLLLSVSLALGVQPEPWKRHVIDAASRGADGVRLADVDGDGRLDIVTGWEEGGVVRIYRNPGAARSRDPWPAVTVGRVGSPEDAVFADLDSDGSIDVVSSSEGSTRSLNIHWAPRDRKHYWDPDAWTTQAVPGSVDRMGWMFAVPLQIDGRNGLDIVAGGRSAASELGWWQAPPNPRALEQWRWHPLRRVGWIMSIIATDMDSDGDLDLLCSDRKGDSAGVFWLENPGSEGVTSRWKEHPVGSTAPEVMFIDQFDLDGDGRRDVLVPVKPREIHWHRRISSDGRKWQTSVIATPADTGHVKSVRAADLDGNGKVEIIFSCEGTPEGKSGVMALRYPTWEPFPISGWPGIKYDVLELVDLDADGDLDVLTCEETSNLGVIWFENPR